ncbi:MAG: hypothetical protein H2021_02405 [SAR86 cluster bacterium]|uniref:Methyltransferase n=1 Tax=SAR86 cluster bacterium TaxID=2030880 RepID=A0A838YX28_9GAMM|nr:hypothetical protein [SAR86 cluster bacterium]
MSKNRFYDSRLSYLSFVQNTNEKKIISKKIYPYIEKLPKKKVTRFLDAGIGDGTITSNIIKRFHDVHPNSLLLITGKEISFEDVFNSLIKFPDRFVEHPKLAITLTNMKFAELGLLSPTNENLPIIKKNIVLKGKNAYEFEQQLEKLDSFINKNWGFDIDDNGRTAYVRPCLINIYREDCKELIEKNIPKTHKKNEYDFILASQAYRSRSLTKSKIANVIKPLACALKKNGTLIITHSAGNDSVTSILNNRFVKADLFPDDGRSILKFINQNKSLNGNTYQFSKPKNYSYSFRKIPSEIVNQMSSSSLDSKISNLFYIGQLSNDEKNLILDDQKKMNKLKKLILNQDRIIFNNEIFSIKKL